MADPRLHSEPRVEDAGESERGVGHAPRMFAGAWLTELESRKDAGDRVIGLRGWGLRRRTEQDLHKTVFDGTRCNPRDASDSSSIDPRAQGPGNKKPRQS